MMTQEQRNLMMHEIECTRNIDEFRMEIENQYGTVESYDFATESELLDGIKLARVIYPNSKVNLY